MHDVMTSHEAKIERQKVDIRTAESRLREAQKSMEHGYAKGQAELQKLKAETERDYGKMKSEVERAQLDLERERIYLQELEDNGGIA